VALNTSKCNNLTLVCFKWFMFRIAYLFDERRRHHEQTFCMYGLYVWHVWTVIFIPHYKRQSDTLCIPEVIQFSLTFSVTVLVPPLTCAASYVIEISHFITLT